MTNSLIQFGKAQKLKRQVIEDAKLGEAIGDRLTRLKIKYQAAKERLDTERAEFVKLDNQYAAHEKALQILQDIAQAIQQEMHQRIASVVSRCLESVFDEPYQFQIDFEQKSGKTVANLAFVRDGLEIDPLTSSGGGVVDVASFALRLACLMLRKPKLRRVLILDEPFRFVSANYLPRVKNLIETLADEMDIQVIIVTHIKQLQIGKVVEL